MTAEKKTHFIEIGKLWVDPSTQLISGSISLGLLGNLPFIARRPSYGGGTHQNMLIASDKTPIGMLKLLLAELIESGSELDDEPVKTAKAKTKGTRRRKVKVEPAIDDVNVDNPTPF